MTLTPLQMQVAALRRDREDACKLAASLHDHGAGEPYFLAKQLLISIDVRIAYLEGRKVVIEVGTTQPLLAEGGAA